MYIDILNHNQKEILPLLKELSEGFGLVGGTAIALHIGHRRSSDYDLFSIKEFNTFDIQKKIFKRELIDQVLVDQKDEYTILIKGVKITFFYYPFNIEFKENFNDICHMGDLLTLGALKAYALGRRVKWKDYVDLYFIMKDYHSINEIIVRAKEIFKTNFNEKLFRSQLSYFKDIDYSEEIIYMNGKSISDEKIQKKLIDYSLSE